MLVWLLRRSYMYTVFCTVSLFLCLRGYLSYSITGGIVHPFPPNFILRVGYDDFIAGTCVPQRGKSFLWFDRQAF